MSKTVIIDGRRVRVEKSDKPGAQRVAVFPNGRRVYYGDPAMPEYPGTRRGDNYCARSSGIKGTNDPYSANFWSRKDLWNCRGKESMERPVLRRAR